MVLTAGDNEDGSTISILTGGTGAYCQQFTDGHRLTRLESKWQNRRVELARREEVCLHAHAGLGRDIAHGVLISKRRLLDGDKAASKGKLGEVDGDLAETGKRNGAGALGVEIGKAVGDGAAKGVTRVDDVFVAGVTADAALGKLAGQLVEGGDLKEYLGFVDRILGVGRL